MYTWEIANFLSERDHKITTREDFHRLVNKVDNPQITDVKYIGWKMFQLTTEDGGNFIFQSEI